MVRLPENKALRAGLLMVCAMGSFVSNDTIIKVVGSSLPVGEIIALRGVMAMLIIAAICAWQGVLADVRAIASRPVVLRNLFDLVSTVAFVTALMHMQIANLTAVMQAVPLAVALLSMVILKEQVGPRRMAAIVSGFIGVLMIVKPSVANFNVFDMLALVIVFCVAGRDLLTKRIPARIPTFSWPSAMPPSSPRAVRCCAWSRAWYGLPPGNSASLHSPPASSLRAICSWWQPSGSVNCRGRHLSAIRSWCSPSFPASWCSASSRTGSRRSVWR